MRAGSLRHLVTIQQPVTTKVNGVPSTTWTDFAAGIRASIEQLKPFDKAQANAVWPGAEYSINCRYYPGITGNMRIVDENGAIYSILGHPNDVEGRHRELQMTCERGVKAG